MNKTTHTCVCVCVFYKVQINRDLIFGMYEGDREPTFCILAPLDFEII